VSHGFNILKMNDSTYLHMLIIEKMWKKSLIHSNINVGFKFVKCLLINYGKCIMQPLHNGFSWWFNSCTMLIVEEMSKKSLIHYNALCK
jgi:hypothetical protein